MAKKFDPSAIPDRTVSQLRLEVLRLVNIELAEIMLTRQAATLSENDAKRLDMYGRLVATLERSAVTADAEKTDEEVLDDVLTKLPIDTLIGEIKRRGNGR